jgi:hypothetical protein
MRGVDIFVSNLESRFDPFIRAPARKPESR